MPVTQACEIVPDPEPEHEHARRRVLAHRDFGSHLFAFLLLNAILIVTWAASGAGYFWPGWVLAGWGVALIVHARETFWRRPITETDIDEEIRRRNDGPSAR